MVMEKLSRTVGMPPKYKSAGKFVANTLTDQGAFAFLSDADFVEFRRLSDTGSWRRASHEYRRVTGDDIPTSLYATAVTIAVRDSETSGGL
ncbi:hypothetical protein [Demetria terragena]|uniref:hypothetical protein n=1 Tax=Demetria terragena TaxID=63959 RepID=UPI00036C17A3|nr:hypothetical protein [Demetria terragena]